MYMYLLLSPTGLATWFGCGGATHIVCLGQELSDRAYLSPGLQLVWIQSFLFRLVALPSLFYYFNNSWREISWMHTFTKSICAMWNANSLIQDLNSGISVNFLQ